MKNVQNMVPPIRISFSTSVAQFLASPLESNVLAKAGKPLLEMLLYRLFFFPIAGLYARHILSFQIGRDIFVPLLFHLNVDRCKKKALFGGKNT
jgi:hypothetical protein